MDETQTTTAALPLEKLRFTWHFAIVRALHYAGRDFVFSGRPDWFVQSCAELLPGETHPLDLQILLQAAEEWHARKEAIDQCRRERFAAFL